MADEVRVTFQMTVANGNYSDSFAKTASYSMSAIGAASGIQSIGTSEENLVTTDITTNGFLILQNLDSTNYVDYGLDNAGTMRGIGRIKAGEFAWLRMKPATSLRLQANGGAVQIRFLLLND